MEKQTRLITALAVLLLVLVLIVLFGKDPDDKADADPHEPPAHKVFEGEKDSVQKLTLRGPDGEIAFEKDDAGWKMTAPRTVPIEQRKVTEIVDRMATLEVQERAFEGALKDYGLDDASRVEIVLGKADGTSLSLFVGRDSPVGYRSYVAQKAEGPATLATSKIGDLAHRTVNDFRSPEVWTISSGTATRVRIEDAGNVTVLRKDDHGWWIGDDGPRASEDAIQDWLSRADTLRADTFLDDADPVALGLGTPSATITVEDADGTHTLRFGSREDGAVVQGEGVPVRLGNEALELLGSGAWTATKLLPVRRAQIDTVEVQLGEKSGRWTRAEGKWTDAAGKEATGVDELLDAIGDAASDRTAPLAMAGSWGRVVLAEGTTRREEVLFGDPIGDGARLAKETVGGPGFAIPQASIDAITAAWPR